MVTAILVTKVVVVGLIIGFLFLALGLLVQKAAKIIREEESSKDKMLSLVHEKKLRGMSDSERLSDIAMSKSKYNKKRLVKQNIRKA